MALILAVFLLGGCSLAPGLYVDKIDVPDRDEPHKEVLGGDVKIIPVTAAIAAKLKSERLADLTQKRQTSHTEFMRDNPSKGERYEYRVGAYDVLFISVWEHPEFDVSAASTVPGLGPLPLTAIVESKRQGAVATGHRVDSHGNIFFPHVGNIHVEGLTLPEIRELLIGKLTRFVPDPQVDIGVAFHRSQQVYVMGEVNSPKAIVLSTTPLDIIDAITRAGGVTPIADTRNVTLNRKGKIYKIDLEAMYEMGDLRQNYLLESGDILRVPDNQFNRVYVMGEFLKNRSIMVSAQLFTLADLINHPRIEGLNYESVDTGQILVFRYKDEQYDEASKTFKAVPEVYHLDISSAEAMLICANFPLMSKDIVYAAPTGLTRWNRVVQQILPTLQAIWYPARTMADWDRVIDDGTDN